MAKIGILCPFKEIEDITRKLIEEKQIDVAYLKTTNVSDVVLEARKAIHNGSSHKNSPFVSVNLEAMSDEEQMRWFFKKIWMVLSTQKKLFLQRHSRELFLSIRSKR